MSPINVLLVEDDTSIALVVKMLLKHHGFAVHQFANAEEALATRAQLAPGLIITDLHLKGDLDGRALINEMRLKDPDLPAILISGDFIGGNEMNAENGLVRLGKPFRAATMMRAIANAQKKPL